MNSLIAIIAFSLILIIVIICILKYVILGKERNILISGILIFLISIFPISAVIVPRLVSKEWIPKKNAVTVEADILSLGTNIWISHDTETDETGLRVRHKTNYNRYIIYSYTVDGKEYAKSDILKSPRRSNVENIEGNTIQITYNEKKPDNVIIGKPNYVNYPTTILLTIIFTGFGIILFGTMSIKKNDIYTHNELLIPKGKCKDILLKVFKIEIIDYEREKVFFESLDNHIYYYETDFGEEFNVNEQYEIKLKRYNKEKNRIEYEGNIIKAIKIVNVEKREFIKKE